jgi:hypothetical protein
MGGQRHRFPGGNIKLTMEVGFSIVERDNPFMENLMNEAVDILSNPENYDKKKKEDPMTRCPR